MFESKSKNGANKAPQVDFEKKFNSAKDAANRFADQRDSCLFLAIRLKSELASSSSQNAFLNGFSVSKFFSENQTAIKSFIGEVEGLADKYGNYSAVMENLLDKPLTHEGKSNMSKPSSEEQIHSSIAMIKAIIPAYETACLSLANDGLSIEQRQGIQKLKSQLVNAVLQMGGEVIEPTAADKFDPNLHQAVLQVQHETFQEGTIVELKRSGFKYGTKLVAPALVSVCA